MGMPSDPPQMVSRRTLRKSLNLNVNSIRGSNEKGIGIGSGKSETIRKSNRDLRIQEGRGDLAAVNERCDLDYGSPYFLIFS